MPGARCRIKVAQEKVRWESELLPIVESREPDEAMEIIEHDLSKPDWAARIVTAIGFLMVLVLGYFAVKEKWYENPREKFTDFTGRVKKAYALILKKHTGYKEVEHVKKVKEVEVVGSHQRAD